MEFNHYQVLGISRNASNEEIKKAYKALAKKYHPDMNPNNAFYEAHFKKINEAHEILSHPTKRGEYDFKLRQATAPSIRPTPSKKQAYKPKSNVTANTMNLSRKQGLGILAFFIVMSIGGYFFYHFMNEYTSNQYYETGLMHQKKGDYEGARVYYHQALEMDKSNYKVHKQLAYCLINHAENVNEAFREASYLFQYLITHQEGNTDSLKYSLAQCYISLDEYENALQSLSEIPLAFNDSILIFKGECYIQKKEWKQALATFQSYIQQHPLSDLCFQKTAYIQYRKGMYNLAKEEIQKAISINRNNGAHHYIKGLIALGETDTLMACHDFHTSLDLAYEMSEQAIQIICK